MITKILTTILFLLFVNLSHSQTFKMYLKIMDQDSTRSNSLKYTITVQDCTKDSIYDYITPSNFVLLFNYDTFYKITITSHNTSVQEFFFSNYGPHKNFLMNLSILLNDDIADIEKKVIYYSKSRERYFIEKL